MGAFGGPDVQDLLVIGAAGPGELTIKSGNVTLLPGQGGIKIGADYPGNLDMTGNGAEIFANDGNIDIGNTAQMGTMTVRDKAKVTAKNVNLTGPVGTQLRVLDRGTEFLVIERLNLGGSARLSIADEAIVEVDKTVTIDNSSRVAVDSGELRAGAPTLKVPIPGSVKVTAPSLDLFRLTQQELVVKKNGVLTIQSLLRMAQSTRVEISPELMPDIKVGIPIVQIDGGSIDIGQVSSAPLPNYVRIAPDGRLDGAGFFIGPNRIEIKNDGFIGLFPYLRFNRPFLGPQQNSTRGLASSAGLDSRRVSRVTRDSEPTNEIGSLTFNGNLEQTTNGTLHVLVSGPEPLLDYGVLHVTGTLKLAGKVVFEFTDGFGPKRGQTLDFVRSSSSPAGQFDQVEIEGLAPGFQYELKWNGSDGYTLTALNDGIPTSQPELSLDRLGNGLQISWPDFLQGYTLQTTPNLSGLQSTGLPADECDGVLPSH